MKYELVDTLLVWEQDSPMPFRRYLEAVLASIRPYAISKSEFEKVVDIIEGRVEGWEIFDCFLEVADWYNQEGNPDVYESWKALKRDNYAFSKETQQYLSMMG